MMQQAIDRSTQTGGSFAASLVVHVLLLLLVSFLVGRAALEKYAADELTHIAYIEARYGEDVAEKVKLKEIPSRKPAPGPPGPGITTDSAMKKPKPAVAEPTPPPQARPEVAQPQRQPQLEPAPRLEPVQKAPVERPQLASAPTPKVAPAATVAPRELAANTTLESRAAPAPVRQVVDSSQLERSLAGQLNEQKDSVPRPAAPAARQTFQPRNTGLQDRGGRAAVGDEPAVVAATTSRPRAGQVAEAEANLGGGSLSARTQEAGAYTAPRSGLAPPGTARGGAGQPSGIVDAGVPDQGAGAVQGGRKTILDYGSGGGSGGGLSGRRGRLAEAPANRDIVASSSNTAARNEAVIATPEAKLDGAQGVGMSISGQIAGRKILHSVPAEYSERARRQGWEGVVAVRFTVLPDGRVKDNVFLDQTSVHRDLNQAALAAIRQFRFAPLGADQSNVEQWGVITIVFRLH